MASILEQQKALIGQKLEQRKDVIGSSANREDFVGLVDGSHSSLLRSLWKKGFPSIAHRKPAPRQNTQMVLITIKSTGEQTLKVKICERKEYLKILKQKGRKY